MREASLAVNDAVKIHAKNPTAEGNALLFPDTRVPTRDEIHHCDQFVILPALN